MPCPACSRQHTTESARELYSPRQQRRVQVDLAVRRANDDGGPRLEAVDLTQQHSQQPAAGLFCPAAREEQDVSAQSVHTTLPAHLLCFMQPACKQCC